MTSSSHRSSHRSSRRLRRQLTVAVATLGLAGVLSSCGFDYATNRPNEIANAGQNIEGEVHVMGARIVSPAEGAGTFIATLTTDAQADPATFESLTGERITAGEFQPIEIDTHGMVNLATDGGVPVTGEFAAGDAFTVTLGFTNGEELDVTAVVVAQCHEYEDVEPQAAPTPTRAPRGGDDEASAEASAEPTGEPVDCEYPSAPPLGGGEH